MWVPSNHHVPPAEVSDLACQPPILICVGAFQQSFAASRVSHLACQPPTQFFLCKFQAPSASVGGGKPCMQYRRHLRKRARLLDFRAQFPSTISKRPPVPERRPTLHAKRVHFRNRGQHQNFRGLLEHGLPWVTVFGPTSLDWGPKNSTKGRGIQESTGNPQIAKLLASQEKISRGGVLRHVTPQPRLHLASRCGVRVEHQTPTQHPQHRQTSYPSPVAIVSDNQEECAHPRGTFGGTQHNIYSRTYTTNGGG